MTAVVEIVSPDGVATVEIGIVGPQGPPGEPGAAGSAPQAYVHNQGVPGAVWSITHNLGFYPNVTVQDSTGRTVEGDVTYLSDDALTVAFSAAFGGVAYLS